MSNVVIKNTKKFGRGLYAVRDFKKGEIIEVSQVIVLDEVNTRICDATILGLYLFQWGKKENHTALALGHGSLFNHSFKANVKYEGNSKEMVFTAARNIQKGKQLFIDYGYDPTMYKGY